jgi:hypothetical protein
MLTKMLRPAVLMSLALAMHGVGYAAEMAIDCRLRGGTVVQLSAEACNLEGGTQVNAAAAPVSGVASAPVAGNISGIQLPPASLSKLEEAQQVIVGLLGKTVESGTPLMRNPEAIERSAKFDGCKLVVDEQIHVEYGNAYSVWRDFKVNAVVDFQKIDKGELGTLEKVGSKGGDLTGAAVTFEERKNEGGNNISISVRYLSDGNYTKYTVHGPSAYWDTPQDDLWIEDEYGYTKDTGWDTAATDRIRILFIVNSLDDATKLKNAFEAVNTMCKQQE